MEGDESILKSIEQVYYEDEDQFKLDHLTSSFPSPMTTDYLINHKQKLEKQVLVVTRRVSDSILNNQPAYVEELQRITDLQRSLTQSIKVCTSGRECLDKIKSGFTKNGLLIVDNHRKRQLLSELLESLTAINSINKTITQIESIVGQDDNFPEAIHSCLNSKAMLTNLSYFDCVKELDLKLHHTLEHIGDQVDDAISKICLKFDAENYAKLQESHKLLGRTSINEKTLNSFKVYHNNCVEELKMFIENETWEVVPVKSSFRLIQLKEFSFLRVRTNDYSDHIKYEDDEADLDYDSDDDDELFDELNRDFIDEDGDLALTSDECQAQTTTNVVNMSGAHNRSATTSQKSSPVKHPTIYRGPVLTNTSLNVLRLFGRYIQMMRVLEPISFDILLRLYNLLDHYTIYVFEMFGPDNTEQNSGDEKNISPRLKLIIKSIRESLSGSGQSPGCTSANQSPSRHANQSSTSSPSHHHQSHQRHRSHGMINLAALLSNDVTNQKGEEMNPKKSVAIESLIVLVNQLWQLQEYLESLIPVSKRPLLKEQFSQNNSLVSDFLRAKAELTTADQTVSAASSPVSLSSPSSNSSHR